MRGDVAQQPAQLGRRQVGSHAEGAEVEVEGPTAHGTEPVSKIMAEEVEPAVAVPRRRQVDAEVAREPAASQPRDRPVAAAEVEQLAAPGFGEQPSDHAGEPVRLECRPHGVVPLQHVRRCCLAP
jgi:hypothetical protein